MRNIILNRVYLENFKVFDKKTLEFVKGLNVFDGPNGYGKTSVFDAIEFIVTGQIKRVAENNAVDGKVKYKNMFLANDPLKDVVVKAEFLVEGDENLTYTIAKVIKGSIKTDSIDYNPKKLQDIADTYLLDSFEDYEYADNKLIPKETLKIRFNEIFGANSQSLYHMLYYVSQEDRLDYFKNTESERVNCINSLFQITDEMAHKKRIMAANSKLKKIKTFLDKEIDRLSTDFSKQMYNIKTENIEYKRLFTKDIPWDSEEIIIYNDSYIEIKKELSALKDFVSDFNWYKFDKINSWSRTFLDLHMEEQEKKLRIFLLCNAITGEEDEYEQRRKLNDFLCQQKTLALNKEYVKIDYIGIASKLNINIDNESVLNLQSEYKRNNDMISNTKQTLNSILKLREELIEKIGKHIDFNDSSLCPYCGYNWMEARELSANVNNTTYRLIDFLKQSSNIIIDIEENLKKIYDDKVEPIIENISSKIENDFLFREYCDLNSPQLKQQYIVIKDALKMIDIEYENYLDYSLKKYDTMKRQLLKNITECITVIPDTYYTNNEKHHYSSIVDKYFNFENDLNSIDVKDVENKEAYIDYSFMYSQSELSKKIKELNDVSDCITKQIIKKMKEYSDLWKQCIEKYQTQIISQIEIPFYIYSARILQSYQGGQGVFIKEPNQKDEISAIRFTAAESDHDVLYTMSSGQLSGVLLSFSLALNKVFVSEGLRVILIDDPVQCMDDLNIVSFVELLKNEFANDEILISTHEKGFTNYITYKYIKHKLANHTIDLKKINASFS